MKTRSNWYVLQTIVNPTVNKIFSYKCFTKSMSSFYLVISGQVSLHTTRSESVHAQFLHVHNILVKNIRQNYRLSWTGQYTFLHIARLKKSSQKNISTFLNNQQVYSRKEIDISELVVLTQSSSEMTVTAVSLPTHSSYFCFVPVIWADKNNYTFMPVIFAS